MVRFAWIGRPVEVRAVAGRAQSLADHRVIAVHSRHTPERILIDPAHHDGPSMDTVTSPPPLGRMGRKLETIAASRPEQRALDLCAAPGGDAPITSKATTETVDLDATRQPLGLLGLVHAAEQLDTLISATVKHDTTPHRLVDQLLDAELDRREEHRLQTSLRLPARSPART
ncbi:hypothetical protein [Thiohalocapsa halophila]|uniref:hypothetical protein n=1 Tax=Thiohalocapsa halophila TaxID=69359 RepID=UPI001908AE89|nr:hypothetical protein [Thiohalocapsa halophila]